MVGLGLNIGDARKKRRTATVDPVQTAAVQPAPAVDPMAQTFGYVPKPEANAGFLDRYKYMNRTSPSALMQLGAGIASGDMAGGFFNAAQGNDQAALLQQRAQEQLYGHQEEQKSKNLTRQWLRSRFPEASDTDLDAAIANPNIMADLMKPAASKDDFIEVDGQLYHVPSGEFVRPGGAGGGFDLGTGTDARALEYLVETGVLTRQQAAEVAAGKTITNPADGSQWFMTPQGLVGVDAAGNPIDPAKAAPAAQPGGGAAQPGAPAVAGGRQVTPAKPVTGTEGERRAQLLYEPTRRQAKIALDNYDALSSKMGVAARIGEQLPGIAGTIVKTVGDYATTPEYQKARNAIKTVYTNWLYATSGATATPSEQETQADLLMPRPGEDAASIEGKKQQIRDYEEGIRKAQGVLARKEKPGAIPQATWDAMTDEEKARF